MIKKLNLEEVDNPGEATLKAFSILNQLVDAVNELQHDNSEKANCQENVQDMFAEQRRWIGKLCKFRYGLGVTPTYGILGEIFPDSVFPYYKKDTDTYWKYCEPVKPDDNIIYKGE